MKLTITCLHCQKENEILLQSMCITPKKEEPKKYRVAYFHNIWNISCELYESLEDFYSRNKNVDKNNKAYFLQQ